MLYFSCLFLKRFVELLESQCDNIIVDWVYCSFGQSLLSPKHVCSPKRAKQTCNYETLQLRTRSNACAQCSVLVTLGCISVFAELRKQRPQEEIGGFNNVWSFNRIGNWRKDPGSWKFPVLAEINSTASLTCGYNFPFLNQSSFLPQKNCLYLTGAEKAITVNSGS